MVLLVHVAVLLEIVAVVRVVAGGRRQRGSSIGSLREKENQERAESKNQGGQT